MDGRVNPLMDRKVVGAAFLEWLQWSPQGQLVDVVWRSVVQCTCFAVTLVVVVVVVAAVVVVVNLVVGVAVVFVVVV